jgi:HEAT repeat protein
LAALPGALDPLCRLLLRQEDMQARKLICRVLAAVAKDDPGALAARAAGQPWYLARNIAYVLGRIGNSRTVPILKRWVKHEDEQVRVEVARALGRVRDPGAGPLLAEMLADTSWHVRQTAVWALAGRAENQALPQLRHILFEDRTFRTRRPEERDDFFKTYGRLANGAAFDELVQLLEQRSLMCVGWQAELRRGAALALGETERPEAARLLRLHQRERDPRLREAVGEALRNLRSRVTASFDDADDWTRPAARAARSAAEAAFKLEFAVEK